MTWQNVSRFNSGVRPVLCRHARRPAVQKGVMQMTPSKLCCHIFSNEFSGLPMVIHSLSMSGMTADEQLHVKRFF
jgi:hypothetical protein